MASGDNEHRMLFDLRGKRRNVVKVVYATLAVLMGLSLFLVIGGFNIAELFSSNGTSGNAAEPYEEQAERIEARLKKDPENPDLLLSLTRAYVNAANAQVTVEGANRSIEAEGFEEYEKADQAWSDYLKATDQPNPNLALLMSSALIQMAEFSQSFGQAEVRIKAAAEAQEIVAKARPSLNSFATLAFYTYFTGDTAAAEEARAKAKKFATSKTQEDEVDKQLDEYKKNASRYLREREQAEKAASAEGGQASPESLENPLGGFGGGGLTE
ncbi:MAG TPA: hypothetical protein VFT79_12035 [Solirubrobacterales bacterium]|nr:hypothetical protein [Solirubrobacterales bacterium]